ncbi:SpoIVB peptidase, partial [bacterium 1XD42-8]
NYEPANNLLLSGDYIETLNGQEVKNKEDLIQKINQSNGKETVLGIRRGKESFGVKVMPIQTSPEEYKIGIWVRDNTQGIGTLTFLDEFNGFGALGHGINDVDTSKLMELEGGFLYHTEIVSVIKGESGNPGELTGVIDYAKGNVLGTILKNTNGGIFGSGNSLLIDKVGQEALPICLKQDIKLGPGKILCSVNGTPVYYDVEITKVDYSADSINKGIVFKVRDENLLALTGGIVQGMSGSPIIQDGKFVGAVTHVFVQDSTKGFGIFIENMLEANLE